MNITKDARSRLALLCQIYNRLWIIHQGSIDNRIREAVDKIDAAGSGKGRGLVSWEANTKMKYDGRNLTESDGEIYFHAMKWEEMPGLNTEINVDAHAVELARSYLLTVDDFKNLLPKLKGKGYSKEGATYLLDNLSSIPQDRNNLLKLAASVADKS